MSSELIDPFKRLPAEILLTIIKIEPDLQSLYCFTKASPGAAEVFRMYASEIVEEALGRLPEDLRRIIHGVARCLPSNLDPHVTGDAQLATEDMSKENDESLLPRDPPSWNLVLLLGLAFRVHQLAASFFSTYVDRINRICPMHLSELEWHYSLHPLEDQPEGRAYNPARTGPPSWAEECRVVRALWLLQFYYIVASHYVVPLEFPSDYGVIDPEDHRTSNRTLPSVWGDLRPWEVAEMECLQIYLDDSNASLLEPPPDQLNAAPAPTILPYQPWDDTSLAFQQAPEAASRASPAFRFFRTYGQHGHKSPLKHIPWKEFQPLGFSIWDLKRLAMLELIHMPQESPLPGGIFYTLGVGVRLTQSDCCFTWLSIKGHR